LSDIELIEAWLEWKLYNQGRAEGTANKYRLYLLRLMTFLSGRGCSLLSASYDDLRHFTGEFAHKDLKLTPRARRPLVACVRGFYGWARDNGLSSDSPAERLEYPRSGRALPSVMMISDAEKILMQPDLDTFTGVRDAALLATLFGTGLRMAGLVGLNESNLCFYQDDFCRDRLAIKVKEKGDHERLVPAPDDVMFLIRAYLGHKELKGIDRALVNGDRVLFVSVRNRSIPEHEYYGEARRISSRSVDDMIKKYGRAVGVSEERLHAHAARHMYGTEMAEDDVDIITRQKLMGHADANTLAIYTQLALRRLSRVVDKSNPLAKIRTPVTGIREILEKRS